MEIIKSVKTKLYPTASQKADLFRMFNADRFVYNQLLGMIKDHHFGDYKKDITKPNIPSKIDLIKTVTELKEAKDWLYDTPNDYLQASAANLGTACSGFYRGGGYPKFKSRKTTKQSLNMYAGSRVKIIDDELFIPNRKEPIKFSKHYVLPQEYKITGYTISKDSVGDYWLSFTYKFEAQDKEFGELNPVGCDLGLKETLIASNGKMYPRIHLTKKYEKKLAKAQKQLSKKKKGSKNRTKAKLKVAKIHRKIANTRKHNNHRKLSKAIQDVAWYQLTSMIQYKQSENQGLFHRIDKFYPSSKTCSCCGKIKESLSLSERIYTCNCGLIIDRDVNASINILCKALKDSGFTEQEIQTQKELLRNNQELSKIKSVETKVRPAMAQVNEAERKTEPNVLFI